MLSKEGKLISLGTHQFGRIPRLNKCFDFLSLQPDTTAGDAIKRRRKRKKGAKLIKESAGRVFPFVNDVTNAFERTATNVHLIRVRQNQAAVTIEKKNFCF